MKTRLVHILKQMICWILFFQLLSIATDLPNIINLSTKLSTTEIFDLEKPVTEDTMTEKVSDNLDVYFSFAGNNKVIVCENILEHNTYIQHIFSHPPSDPTSPPPKEI